MEKRKRGDVREDGMVFIRYKRNKEIWGPKEKLERLRHKDLLANDKQTKSIEGHALKIIAGRKRHAKINNIPFNISNEELIKNLPEYCPILNIKLSWCERKGQAGNKNTSPSLDRFYPELGYVKGNVFWVSFLANRIKSNFSTDQINAVANWMKQIEQPN